MASARYTLNIDPEDLKPDEPVEHTPKEKLANWWHYHWQIIAVVAVVVLTAAYFIYDAVSEVRPDYQVAVVSAKPMPEFMREQLSVALSSYGQDVNEDGKVIVEVKPYQITFEEPDFGDSQAADMGQAMADMTSGYTQMAETTVLSTDLSAGDSVIFLVDDVEGFQNAYGVLSDVEGQLSAEEYSMQGVDFFAWNDCPALTKLDLGTYTNGAGEQMDGQEYMSRFVVARRGFGKKVPKTLEQSEELFASMTADAKVQ